MPISEINFLVLHIVTILFSSKGRWYYRSACLCCLAQCI